MSSGSSSEHAPAEGAGWEGLASNLGMRWSGGKAGWRARWTWALCGAVAAAVACVAWAGTGDLLGSLWPRVALRDAALLGVAALSAWGFGSLGGRWLLDGLGGFEHWLASVSLGLGAQALLFMALGLSGLLARTGLAIVLSLGVVALALSGAGWTRRADMTAAEPLDWRQRLLIVVAVAAVLVALAAAVMPEVFYDALQYHVPLAEYYLRQGRIEALTHMVHGVMPANVHMLFLPLVAWGGASTVKLAHWLLWVGCGCWVGVCAQRIGGRSAGLAAAVTLFGVAGISVMAGFGGVDHGVAFFVLGAASLTVAAQAADKPRLIFAASWLMGVAVGSKYTALPALGLWSGLTIWWWLRSGKQRRHVPLLCIAFLVGGVVASPWYVRNWVVLGSPVYPVGWGLGSEAAATVTRVRSDATAPGSWWNAPLDAVEALGELRPMGAGSELLPAAILLGAALMWGVGRKRGTGWLAAFAWGQLLIWSRMVQVVRYAYPALGLAAVLAGIWAAASGARRSRTWPLVLVAAVSLAGTARALMIQQHLLGDRSAYLLGREDAATFLSARVPYFRAAMWVRTHTAVSSTRVLLLGETQGAYYAREVVPISAYNHHPFVDWIKGCRDVSEFAAVVRMHGITHIVANSHGLHQLQARYDHLPLTPDESAILREFLAACRKVFDEGGRSVIEVHHPL